MAWVPLKTDYTDRAWVGNQKFQMIDNGDGTVSFVDVTQYTQEENSFFGAIDSNKITEAINAIMEALEDGTDLYTAFQAFFDNQKYQFVNEVNTKTDELDDIIAGIENDYESDMESYEQTQQAIFNTWFDLIKGQLSEDAAGEIQLVLNSIVEMTYANKYYAPLTDDDGNQIIDDDGMMIAGDWKYVIA